MESKVCTKCGEDKPISEYTKRHDRPIGVRPWCKACQRKLDNAYRKTERGEKKARKSSWKQQGIDITYEEYKDKYVKLKGMCEICGGFFISLCVDHNHSTNEIRGLLCTPCNLGLESFKESEEVMSKAISYLTKYGSKHE